MGAPQFEQAGADISGTGTTNTIPRWTGPSTLGDSVLVQVGSNIGVGMTSGFPGRLGVLSQNLIGSADITFSFDAAGSFRHGFSNVFSSLTAANNTSTWLVWNAAGGQTQVMTANGAGNVGIGTASPAGKLEVSGASDQTVWITATSAGSTTLSLYPSGGGLAQINAVGASNLAFRTNSTERARIDSAGRLLVGTTGTPSSSSVRVVVAAASGGQQWHSQGLGGCAVVPSVNTAQWYVYPGANVGSEGYLSSVKLTETGLDVTTASATPGIKLPATPGNADTQTLDCYAETTLNSGFTTSGITSTGTFTVTARATRIGRSIALTVKITPSGGASLTFASGWYVTLTGIPQMPDIAAFAAISNDATGARGSIFCDAAATPTIYGGTAGAYALGTNISLLVSGIVT